MVWPADSLDTVVTRAWNRTPTVTTSCCEKAVMFFKTKQREKNEAIRSTYSNQKSHWLILFCKKWKSFLVRNNTTITPSRMPSWKIRASGGYYTYDTPYLAISSQVRLYSDCQLLLPGRLFGFLFPISQPQPLSTFTTFGVTAAVKGTRKKIKDLWTAYANANCVQIPKRIRKYISTSQ